MAKDKHKKHGNNDGGSKKLRNIIKEQKRELEAEERRIQKKRRAIMAACSHHDGKGFTVDFEKKGAATCRVCGSRFSVRTFKPEEIREATNVVNSALQQVRMIADPREDEVIIAELGKLGADVIAVQDIYKRHLDRYSKGNHNGNKNKDKGNKGSSYGGYGVSGIISTMEDAGYYNK